MQYFFAIKDHSGADVHVRLVRGVFRSSVYYDGKPLSRSKEKGKPFIIPMPGGAVRRMQVRNINFFDFAPRVLIDGEQVFAVEQLQSYEYIWAGLPLLFMLLGSPLGGLIGVAAAAINIRIFRSDLPAPIQALATLGVTILSGIIWMFLSIYLMSRSAVAA